MMQFIDKLTGIAGADCILQNESMKKHTTFRVGGPADYYVTVDTREKLRDVILLCRRERVPFYILGNGSNLLVSDKGIRGVVINTSTKLNRVVVEGTRITAEAGCNLAKVAREALNAELTGMEFAAGIPGTLGGAVVMNAGAYGSDISHIITEATVLTIDGEFIRLSKDALELGYRTSCIERNKYIVIEAVFELKKGKRADIASYMEELAARRREKQPLEYPSAGSTFKRPEGYFAGKLIEDSGLSGFRVGGASVSTKHCGFVINDKEGTAGDILELCNKISEVVRDRFGVGLEMEIKKIGDF